MECQVQCALAPEVWWRAVLTGHWQALVCRSWRLKAEKWDQDHFSTPIARLLEFSEATGQGLHLLIIDWKNQNCLQWGQSNLVDPAESPKNWFTKLGFWEHFVSFSKEKQQKTEFTNFLQSGSRKFTKSDFSGLAPIRRVLKDDDQHFFGKVGINFPPPTPKSADFTSWTWLRKKSSY